MLNVVRFFSIQDTAKSRGVKILTSDRVRDVSVEFDILVFGGDLTHNGPTGLVFSHRKGTKTLKTRQDTGCFKNQ